MAETRPIRHHIDFQLVPQLFHNDKEAFSQSMTLGARKLLAGIFNDVYEKSKPHFWSKVRKYTEKDFNCHMKLYGSDCAVLYVELPPKEDGSHVWCDAYALVTVPGGNYFYTVEESAFGTRCVGTVDQRGAHINLGDPAPSREAIMEQVSQMARQGAGDLQLPVRKPEPPMPVPEPPVREPEELEPEPWPEDTDARGVPASWSLHRNISDGALRLERKYGRDWRPSFIGDELEYILDTLTLLPIAEDPEARARWLMEKIHALRDIGVREQKLYLLKRWIAEFAPGYVAAHFDEYMEALGDDLTPYYHSMEEGVGPGPVDRVRKLTGCALDRLERLGDEPLRRAYHFRSPLERAMWILENGRPIDRRLEPMDYSRPVAVYAEKMTLGTDPECEERKRRALSLLELAVEAVPCSEVPWVGLMELRLDPERYMEYGKQMLRRCTDKESLARAYGRIAKVCYWENDAHTAAALLRCIRELGGRDDVLESKVSDITLEPGQWRQLMEAKGIQIGFSQLVLDAVRFLEDPRSGLSEDLEVMAALYEIRSVDLEAEARKPEGREIVRQGVMDNGMTEIHYTDENGRAMRVYGWSGEPPKDPPGRGPRMLSHGVMDDGTHEIEYEDENGQVMRVYRAPKPKLFKKL